MIYLLKSISILSKRLLSGIIYTAQLLISPDVCMKANPVNLLQILELSHRSTGETMGNWKEMSTVQIGTCGAYWDYF